MNAIKFRDSMSSKNDEEPNVLMDDGLEEVLNPKVMRSEFKYRNK